MSLNSNPLIVSFGFQRYTGDSKIIAGRTTALVDSTPSTPWKTTRYKMTWETLPPKVLKGMNFFFTLNPDTNIDYYENTKKWLVPKLLLLLDELKGDGLIKKSLVIYEYGKTGKIHFHGFFKTEKRHEVYEKICKVFNKQTNYRHRTLRMDHIRTVADRTKMLNYCKKDEHNKSKCLYWN